MKACSIVLQTQHIADDPFRTHTAPVASNPISAVHTASGAAIPAVTENIVGHSAHAPAVSDCLLYCIIGLLIHPSPSEYLTREQVLFTVNSTC